MLKLNGLHWIIHPLTIFMDLNLFSYADLGCLVEIFVIQGITFKIDKSYARYVDCLRLVSNVQVYGNYDTNEQLIQISDYQI